MNVFKYERIAKGKVRLTAPDGTTREAPIPDLDIDSCQGQDGPLLLEDVATEAIMDWVEELGLTSFAVADGFDGEWVYGDHGTAETGPQAPEWQFVPAVQL